MKDLLDEILSDAKIKDIVESAGYEFVGAERVTENGRSVFRVYIDSIGGVSVSDCETVSRELDRFLERHSELVPEHFFLEVSSPGIERPLFTLEDFSKFIGRKVKVRFQEKIKDKRQLTAEIAGVGEGVVRFREEKEVFLEVPFDNITKARLVDDGEETSRLMAMKKKERKKGRKK